MNKYLDKALIEYAASEVYPFHMPGHKRQRLGDFAPEDIDITEIEGFDELYHAEGILREGQERLARVFGADESFYLVNGSTAGILAAVCGCMKKGGRLLIARNCHQSVYHAAYLAEAKLEYLYPERADGPRGSGEAAEGPAGDGFEILGSISPGQAKEALRKFPDVQAVVITSPTYDGVVSDIRSIADIAHAAGIPLIVDEAHGAHFGFAESFPQKAIALGADLCVESLHKTLPAYTQSATLHMMRTAKEGYRFDDSGVRRYLEIFQSSSPSYVLMAGIDRCVRMIEEDMALYADPGRRSGSRFGQFEERLCRFYGKCEALSRVRVYSGGIFERDPSRILISAEGAGLHGQQLYDLLLDKYHLQMEMAAGNYVVALTSVMDRDEGFERLFEALAEIDRGAGSGKGPSQADPGTLSPDESILYAPKEKQTEIAQAMDAEAVCVPISEAAGLAAAEYVCLYPPGIPILVPGEMFTEEVAGQLILCKKCGMNIRGLHDFDVKVVKDIEKSDF